MYIAQNGRLCFFNYETHTRDFEGSSDNVLLEAGKWNTRYRLFASDLDVWFVRASLKWVIENNMRVLFIGYDLKKNFKHAITI